MTKEELAYLKDGWISRAMSVVGKGGVHMSNSTLTTRITHLYRLQRGLFNEEIDSESKQEEKSNE